jgi:hypothetical protein
MEEMMSALVATVSDLKQEIQQIKEKQPRKTRSVAPSEQSFEKLENPNLMFPLHGKRFWPVTLIVCFL